MFLSLTDFLVSSLDSFRGFLAWEELERTAGQGGSIRWSSLMPPLLLQHQHWTCQLLHQLPHQKGFLLLMIERPCTLVLVQGGQQVQSGGLQWNLAALQLEQGCVQQAEGREGVSTTPPPICDIMTPWSYTAGGNTWVEVRVRSEA